MPLVLGLAMLALTAAGAQAQDVFVEGNAQGCFGIGCTPVDIFGPFVTASGATLTYGSALGGGSTPDFRGSTAGGSLAINGTTGSFGFIGLGASDPPVGVDESFTLLLTFLNPNVSGPAAIFQALINGTVSSDPTSGGVLLMVSSPPVTRSFTNGIPGDQSGTITVLANNTALPPGQTTQITGFVRVTSGTVTPEPASLLLLATGVAGLLTLALMRRKQMDLA